LNVKNGTDSFETAVKLTSQDSFILPAFSGKITIISRVGSEIFYFLPAAGG
jgi:hypothetical protein